MDAISNFVQSSIYSHEPHFTARRYTTFKTAP